MPVGLNFTRGFMILASSGIVLWLLSWLKPVLMPMVLAILLAFLLSPVVTLLQRLRLPRALAVAAVVMATFSLITGVGWGVARQVSSLVDTFPQYEKNLAVKIGALKNDGPGFIEKTEWIMKRISRQIQKIRPPPIEETRGESTNPMPVKVIDDNGPFQIFKLWSVFVPVVQPFAVFGLSVVLLIFMLLRREDLRDRLIGLVGQGHLTLTTKALDEAGERISRYLLRQLAINAGFGAAIALGLYALDVPYALLWGCFAALLRYIPYVGPWLAALLPLGLSLIVSDSWTQPLLVAALFLTLELITNMFIEPWLYGRTIGVSETAALLMIAFWTWLWGPIGLVLGTPLTAFLVVLGKHVPFLGFFETLLGNQPVLEAYMGYYQRLFARDQDEASDIAATHLGETSLRQTYDRLLIPALTYAKRDTRRELTTEEDLRYVLRATQDIVEELATLAQRKRDSEAAPESRDSDHALEVMRVLAIPAHDGVDEVALHMLKNLLDAGSYEVSLASPGILASEVISLVSETEPALLCIAALPPGGGAPARLLCMRLRARYPELKILVGRWGCTGDVDKMREQFLDAGATQFGATLEETCDQIAAWRPLLADSASAPYPAVSATASR
jgi:predicted PurR-regulated permease PerM